MKNQWIASPGDKARLLDPDVIRVPPPGKVVDFDGCFLLQ